MNILFDGLNNETINAEVVGRLKEIAEALSQREYPRAQSTFEELSKNVEGEQRWLVSTHYGFVMSLRGANKYAGWCQAIDKYEPGDTCIGV